MRLELNMLQVVKMMDISSRRHVLPVAQEVHLPQEL